MGKFTLALLLSLNLVACAHTSQNITANEQTPAEVGAGLMKRLKRQRDITEQRKMMLAAGEQTPADIGAGIMGRLKQQHDVTEKKQFMLAEDITQMKKEKQRLEREQALSDHQARAYGFSLVASNMEMQRRAHVTLPADIYHLNEMIQYKELELMSLQQAPISIGAN